jgi:3-oxoacyl-[acyl-carrier protein] reductase
MRKQKAAPTAWVTGAARGIGLAITEQLLTDGFQVIAIDIDPKPLKVLAKKNTSLFPRQCDVGNANAVRLLSQETLKSHGTPWALINNAGWGGPFHRIDEVSDDEWTRIFDINVRSVFSFSRELLPAMAKAQAGRIINIASIQGLFGAERSSTYAASKHAVIGYTRSIAVEWGRFGVTCNAICPGYIDTSQGARDAHTLNFKKQVSARTPAGRIASPVEVAELVSWIVGPPKRRTSTPAYLNGSILTLDGGITAGTGL